MIEVGEYVRTKNKGIKKIDTIFENRTVNRYGYEIGSEWDGKLYSTIKTTDIVKHSKNIIDLLKVGDIVEMYDVLNEDVIYIWNEKMLKAVKEDVANGIKIRRILTKEQYEANCYKVKEE